MPKKDVLQIKNFSGGVNSYSEPRDLQENEFQILDNAAVDEQGIIRVSGGLELKDNINIEQPINSTLSSPGKGLFSYLSDYSALPISTINSYLEHGSTTADAWGVVDVDGDGTWEFGAIETKTNTASISSFTAINQQELSNSAAINYDTYSAAVNYNHGSLTMNNITLKPNQDYAIELRVISEKPWFYLGSNLPPRIRLFNTVLGKYFWPEDVNSTSEASHTALLNDNIGNLIDSPTAVVGNGSGTAASLTWSSATHGDGSWTAASDLAAHKVERVNLTNFTQASCDPTSGNAVVDHPENANILVGMHVTGAGVPDNTYVSIKNSDTQFTMTNNATASTAVTMSFFTTYSNAADHNARKAFNSFVGATTTDGAVTNGYALKITNADGSTSSAWDANNYAYSSNIGVTAGVKYKFDCLVSRGTSTTANVRIYDVTNGAAIVGTERTVTGADDNSWWHINQTQLSYPQGQIHPITFVVPSGCSNIRIEVGVARTAADAANRCAYFTGFNLRKAVLELPDMSIVDGPHNFLQTEVIWPIYKFPNSWGTEREGSVISSNYLNGITSGNNIFHKFRTYRKRFNTSDFLTDSEESNQWTLTFESGIWGGVNQTGVNNIIVHKFDLYELNTGEKVTTSGYNLNQKGSNIISQYYNDNTTNLNLYSYNTNDNTYIKNSGINLPTLNNKSNFYFIKGSKKVYFCDENFYDRNLYSLSNYDNESSAIKLENINFSGPNIDVSTQDTSYSGLDESIFEAMTFYLAENTDNDAYISAVSSDFADATSHWHGDNLTSKQEKMNDYNGNINTLEHDISDRFKYDEDDGQWKGDPKAPYAKYITIDNDSMVGTGTDKLASGSRIAKISIDLSHDVILGMGQQGIGLNYSPEMMIYLDVVTETVETTTGFARPGDSGHIKEIGSFHLNVEQKAVNETHDSTDFSFPSSNTPSNWIVVPGWYNNFSSDYVERISAAHTWKSLSSVTSQYGNITIDIPYEETTNGSTNILANADDAVGVNLQLRFEPVIKSNLAFSSTGLSSGEISDGTASSGEPYRLYEPRGILSEFWEIKKIEIQSYKSGVTASLPTTFPNTDIGNVQLNTVFETPAEGEADGWDDTWSFVLTSVNQDGVESAFGSESSVFINDDVTKAPRIDLITNVANSTFNQNKFIKGYAKSKRNDNYNLQFVIDCQKRTIKSSTSTYEYIGFTSAHIIQYSIPSKDLLIPNEIDSYESEAGVLIENALDVNKMKATFKTAVIANNTLYAGNVMQEGNHYPDRMLKSPIGKIPLLPSTNFIDVAINDGDEIVSLQFYKDRLLQFKKDKLFIISTSEDYEYLQDTVENVGISQESQVTKTPYGIAWINERGCYLYDGQKVNNLTDRKLAYKKWKDSESSWEIDERYGPTIHYLKKEDKLIVYGATDSLENIEENEGHNFANPYDDSFDWSINKQYLRQLGYEYDIKTQSWTNITSFLETWDGSFDMIDNIDGRLRLAPANNMITNFAYDENGDSIFLIKPSNNILKWDDNPKHTSGNLDLSGFEDNTTPNSVHRDFRIITKDYDFGIPSVKKKIHKVYVTFKSTHLESNKMKKVMQKQDLYESSNVGVYYAINGTNTWTEFSETKSDNYGTKGLISTDSETTTTTSSATSSTSNTVSVTSASNIKVGYVLKIGEEQMLVKSISGTTITIDRNYNLLNQATGSPNFSHSSGATVTISTGDWIVAQLKPASSINNIDSFKLKFETKKRSNVDNDDNGVPSGFLINYISVIYRTKNVR